jgi:hypothetical protein
MDKALAWTEMRFCLIGIFRFVVLLPHPYFHIRLIRIFRFVGMDGALAWTEMSFGMRQSIKLIWLAGT